MALKALVPKHLLRQLNEFLTVNLNAGGSNPVLGWDTDGGEKARVRFIHLDTPWIVIITGCELAPPLGKIELQGPQSFSGPIDATSWEAISKIIKEFANGRQPSNGDRESDSH